ncbi:MAG: WbqC family protein [Luteimonas sp.]
MGVTTQQASGEARSDGTLRVALMQPYFFPYLGYFQLMHAVDCFVFYDDAQFMKGGWVNRNRLLVDGRPGWWTFPVVHASHRLPICGREYRSAPAQTARLIAQVEHAYRLAPHFGSMFPRIAGYLGSPQSNVAAFNQAHLESLARDMGLRCRFLASSELVPGTTLGGQAKVIEICRALGATHYINSPGGQALYDADVFADAGLQLGFLHPRPEPYPQFGQPHAASLSIVDALMFNDPEHMRQLLRQYDLSETSGTAS